MSRSFLSLSAFAAAVLATASPVDTASAQSRPDIVGQIGFSRSTIGGDPAADGFKSRSGFFGGLGLGLTGESGFGGRIEVNYVQKGVELPQEEEVRFGVQLGYIDVPILARYLLGNEDMSVRPAVFLGPSIGFQVDCKQQALDNSSGFYEEVGCPSDVLRTTTFDGVVGVEIEFLQSLVAGVRYSFGFTNLLKEPDSPSLKNRMWALSIGYIF